MKHALAGILAAFTLATAGLPAGAQVAGSTMVGFGTIELRELAHGWSARKQILGHSVVNENGDKLGSIDDVIVAPDGSVSFAIVGSGGFLGVRRHDVAVPVHLLKVGEDLVVLPGATPDAIKALPAFEYVR